MIDAFKNQTPQPLQSGGFNSALRGVDTHEMAASGSSMEDSYFQYLTTGVLDAAVSGGVGVINSLTSLSNLLGTDFAQIKERDAIQNIFGNDSAEFYDRHKTGIDFTGMLMGTTVAGLTAIKLLRAAQVAGEIGEGMQLATGLKNTDIVLGSQAVQEARAAVMAGANADMSSKAVLRAYASGAWQQAKEAVAFEAGMTLGNNQNSTLNPEDLGVWDSIKQQVWDDKYFLLGGAALSATVEGFRITGALKKERDYAERMTGHLAIPDLGNYANAAPGDRLLTALGALKNQDSLATAGETLPGVSEAFAKSRKDLGYEQINDVVQQSLRELNGTTDNSALNQLKEIIGDGKNVDLDKAAELISGAKSFGYTDAREVIRQVEFYAKSAAPDAFIIADDTTSVKGQFRELLSQNKSLTADDVEKIVGAAAFGHTMAGRVPFGEAGIAHRVNVQLPIGHQKMLDAFGEYTKARDWNMVARYGYVNREVLGEFYESWASAKAAITGTKPSFDEMVDYAQLHEFGHLKSNSTEALDYVQQFQRNKPKSALLRQLEQLSRWSKPDQWKDLDAAVKQHAKDLGITEKQMWERYRNPATDVYLLRAKELLADSTAMLVNPASRELARKMAPSAAGMLEKYGGLALPWKDTKLFLNTRTGEVVTSYLPHVNDLGGVTYSKTGSLSVKGVLDFKQDAGAWAEDKLFIKGTDNPTPDFLHYSAQYAMAKLESPTAYLDHSLGGYVTGDKNLARMERMATEGSLGKAQLFLKRADGTITNVSVKQLQDELIATKADFRARMAQAGYNEEEISKFLNIDLSRARGLDAGDWLLMDKQDFSKPETFMMQYDRKSPKDLAVSSKSMAATLWRGKIQEDMQQKASAHVLGDMYTKLQTISQDDMIKGMRSLTTVAGRAGVVTPLRTEVGSLRDFASRVQKQTALEIKSRQQLVAEKLVRFHDHFNKSENFDQRAELSLLTNNLRRDWYELLSLPEGGGKVVRYALRQSAKADLEEVIAQGGDVRAHLNTLVKDGRQDALAMSKEVGEFMELHRDLNARYVGDNSILNWAKGRQTRYDSSRLYPPPHDLRQTPYFAFVIPKDAVLGADPHKYMIFGNTPTELENKVAYIRDNYGISHSVLQKDGVIVRTNGQVIDYKKMMHEYDRGAVFSEMEFDPALVRQGSAQELVPSADVSWSNTLDLYRTWHYKQEERLIRDGVRMKYGELVQRLESADLAFSRSQRATVSGQTKVKDTIFRDTLNLMLDDRSYDGTESLWKQVGGLVGDAGSKVIDSAMSVFQQHRLHFPEAKFDEFNKKLADAGYNPPFHSVLEMNLTSKDPNVSRSLQKLVTSANNLVSTLMLSLDMANSIIQTISTPILLSPVFREVTQALDGDAAKKWGMLTTAINPATGTSEPSLMRMMLRATKDYFGADKTFLNSLKDRGIITDALTEWKEVTDFTAFRGASKMSDYTAKFDKLVEYGKTFSGYKHSEELSRYITAHIAKQIGEFRGMGEEEVMTLASSMIDKVIGQYRTVARPGMFNGVVGQAVGLYQTYMFNWMNNALHWGMAGDKKNLAILGAMQGSVYGLRSFPGFSTFNQMIGETNRSNEDFYSMTNASTPGSVGSYIMYGLGSHVLGIPIDLFSRGDMAVRNSLVVPTTVNDIPAVSVISSALGNIVNTIKLLTNDSVPAKQALYFGLAHNGLNRPLQGIGNILLGQTTTKDATPYLKNANYIEENGLDELSYSSMFARFLGTKPLDEAILLDQMFRTKAYQASARDQAEQIGMGIKLKIASGLPVTGEDFDNFSLQYERSGNDVQNFNAFFARQMVTANQSLLDVFKDKMEKDGVTKRAYQRMMLERSTQPPWMDGLQQQAQDTMDAAQVPQE